MNKIFIFFLFPFHLILAQNVEDFENFNGSSSYSDGIFQGNNGLVYNFFDSKGGQKICNSDSKSICLNKSSIAKLSFKIDSGCSTISFDYEQEYSSNCDLILEVNNQIIAEIITLNEEDICKKFLIENLNFEGNTQITLYQKNSSSGQITIDNLVVKPFYNPDAAPEITDCYLINKTLYITFSKKIYPEISKQNFLISPELEIVSIKNIEKEYCCEIELKNFQSNYYEINIFDYTDSSGKKGIERNFHFEYFPEPGYGDLIISEIMADPTPAVYLPEIEYIELYNLSDFAVELNGFSLKIGSSNCSIPAFILEKANSVVLTSSENISLFNSDTKVIGIDNFPAISNNGADLILSDSKSNPLDIVNYCIDDYDEDIKSEGGWSLERINYENICFSGKSFTASSSSFGGSPGKIDISNISDCNCKSKIISVFPDSLNVLTITVNSRLSDEKTLNKENFEVMGKIFPDSVFFTDYFKNNIRLIFKQNFLVGHIYTLSVSNIYSCDRTVLNGNFTFGITEKTEKNNVLINEILFNPLHEASDFIEIVNVSDKILNIKELMLNSWDEWGQLKNGFEISSQNMLFFPGQYLILSTDIEYYKENYPVCENSIFIKMKYLPSLPDNEGNIIVTDRANIIIDEMNYSSNMHFETLVDVEGISLERLSLKCAGNIKENWCSASESSDFASPGCKNSQSIDYIIPDELLELYPLIISPNNDGIDDNLTIIFNNDISAYSLNALIFNEKGTLIKTLRENLYPGKENIIIWNCSDQKGKLCENGIYILLMQLNTEEGKYIPIKRTVCIMR